MCACFSVAGFPAGVVAGRGKPNSFVRVMELYKVADLSCYKSSIVCETVSICSAFVQQLPHSLSSWTLHGAKRFGFLFGRYSLCSPWGGAGGGNEWGMGHFPEDISVTASGSEWLKVEVKKAMGWEGTPREDGNQEHAARPVPIELPNCKLLPGVLIIF